MVARNEMLRLVHENFANSMRIMARYCGGTVSECDGFLLYASAVPSPFPWNGVVRIEQGPNGDELMSTAREFFGDLGHGFSLLALEGIDDDLIAELGEANDTSPEMVLERAPTSLDLLGSVEIKVVSTEQMRKDFLVSVSEAFETLGESAETWQLCYPSLESLANPESVAMVMYEEGEPVAGGMYYRTGNVIEILHIGTRPSHRRKGCGRAVTTALTIHGFENGATLASLQAEPMGLSTYQRLGYQTISRYHLYVNPPG